MFLVVWRTDCLGCLVEIPILNRLQKEFASEDFTVIGLSMDRERDGYVGRFVRKHKIAYPVWLGYGQPLSEYVRTHIIPTLFAIGPDGEVLGHAVGAIPSYDDAVGAIEQARRMIAERERAK